MLKKNGFNIRISVQIFFFVLIGLIAVNHTLAETGGGIPFLSNASLHSLCPFGGVVTLYQFFSLGTFVKQIHASSVVLMILIMMLAILFGPVFCGWVCPLGSVQEWFGKIGKKILKRKFNHIIPKKLDSALRYIRYGVLVWVVYMTSISGYLIFSELDPYRSLYNFWSSEASLIGIGVLVITLLLSLIIERPWCKYLCPYGALLGITNFFRIFKISRNSKTCTQCKICDNNCPMNIEVSKTEKVLNHQCISCYKCTSEELCPVPDTVITKSISFSRKKEVDENKLEREVE